MQIIPMLLYQKLWAPCFQSLRGALWTQTKSRSLAQKTTVCLHIFTSTLIDNNSAICHHKRLSKVPNETNCHSFYTDQNIARNCWFSIIRYSRYRRRDVRYKNVCIFLRSLKEIVFHLHLSHPREYSIPIKVYNRYTGIYLY